MREQTVADYLARIGARPVHSPGAAGLRMLCDRHLAAVPFENLSIHRGEPIDLAPAALADKIVYRRRGGICYELNGLFAELLTALGYRVSLLAGRVFVGSTVGPPFDHLALRVDLAQPWLVDVGFGRHAIGALPMVGTATSSGLLRPAGEHGDLDLVWNDTLAYRLETRTRTLAEFQLACWYHQTSPESKFTRNLVCSLPLPEGRVTLSGQRLIRTAGTGRTESELDPAATLAAYREIFGFELDRVPIPDPLIA